jgi:hypothetical protein
LLIAEKDLHLKLQDCKSKIARIVEKCQAQITERVVDTAERHEMDPLLVKLQDNLGLPKTAVGVFEFKFSSSSLISTNRQNVT